MDTEMAVPMVTYHSSRKCLAIDCENMILAGEVYRSSELCNDCVSRKRKVFRYPTPCSLCPKLIPAGSNWSSVKRCEDCRARRYGRYLQDRPCSVEGCPNILKAGTLLIRSNRCDGCRGVHIASAEENGARNPTASFWDDPVAIQFVKDHPDGATLEEVGEVLGLTRERVRQLEQQALRKLEKICPNKGITREDVARMLSLKHEVESYEPEGGW